MTSCDKKKIAVFMDRDGTINEEVGYLSRMEQLIVYPEAMEAIRLINENGLPAVVITNQSGIARGYFDEPFVEALHSRINEILGKAHAHIDRFYFCPHHPSNGLDPYVKICQCRKPEPALLVQAAEELYIDLSRSYMIGDTLRDIEAASNAGAKGILVRTGHGTEVERAAGAAYIADHILDAVEWILRNIKA